LPEEKSKNSHIWHLFVVRVKNRDNLHKYLKSKDIGTQVHYPKVLYQQQAVKPFGRGRCPVAEKVVGEILSLPIYPELKDGEVRYVCREINNFFKIKKK